MSSSSSTSNFKPNRLECVPRRVMPVAAIGLVVVIGLIETALCAHREWFADRSAYQWQVKQELLEEGVLDGDIMVMGTSVLFHSVDASRVNALSGSPRRLVNLALNGMALQHMSQMMDRCFSGGRRYEHLLVEFRNVDAPRADWLKGPYWRFWASWRELLQSRVYYHEPSLLLSFSANRFLTSFAYRKALDNWVFACGRTGGVDQTYRDRNRVLAVEMRERLGFSTGDYDLSMTVEDIPRPRRRPWFVSSEGEAWLYDLLNKCVRYGVRVSILLPPSPPFVEEQREASGFYEDYEAHIARLQREYPSLSIESLAPGGYGLEDFSDDHHLSHLGNVRLVEDLARWVASLDGGVD